MFLDHNNIEGFEFSDWRNLYTSHPQASLLKEHVERAVQDIFFASLKEQTQDLFYLFPSEDQIDGFISRMVKYWESQEEYERCSEILELGESFKMEWKNSNNIKDGSEVKIKEWLRTHF